MGRISAPSWSSLLGSLVCCFRHVRCFLDAGSSIHGGGSSGALGWLAYWRGCVLSPWVQSWRTRGLRHQRWCARAAQARLRVTAALKRRRKHTQGYTLETTLYCTDGFLHKFVQVTLLSSKFTDSFLMTFSSDLYLSGGTWFEHRSALYIQIPKGKWIL